MESSYFSEPEDRLDPSLFDGSARMLPGVRDYLLGLVVGALSTQLEGGEYWSRSWVAGSGASYQWSADRSPRDLDVLVGVDYVQFRASNPNLRGLSDQEISRTCNLIFREELSARMADWSPDGSSHYEVTFFVNPGSWDITRIKPYAAYSLTDDEWTVPPAKAVQGIHPEWEEEARGLHAMARSTVQWYSLAHRDINGAENPAHRTNAERAAQSALEQASAIYQRLHEGRKVAFSPGGRGYDDRHNYLWQAAKRDGWMEPIKTLHQYKSDLDAGRFEETTGVAFPDAADDLIRRAAVRTAYPER